MLDLIPLPVPAHPNQAHGQESARQILMELGQAKAMIMQRLDKSVPA